LLEMARKSPSDFTSDTVRSIADKILEEQKNVCTQLSDTHQAVLDRFLIEADIALDDPSDFVKKSRAELNASVQHSIRNASVIAANQARDRKLLAKKGKVAVADIVELESKQCKERIMAREDDSKKEEFELRQVLANSPAIKQIGDAVDQQRAIEAVLTLRRKDVDEHLKKFAQKQLKELEAYASRENNSELVALFAEEQQKFRDREVKEAMKTFEAEAAFNLIAMERAGREGESANFSELGAALLDKRRHQIAAMQAEKAAALEAEAPELMEEESPATVLNMMSEQLLRDELAMGRLCDEDRDADDIIKAHQESGMSAAATNHIQECAKKSRAERMDRFVSLLDKQRAELAVSTKKSAKDLFEIGRRQEKARAKFQTDLDAEDASNLRDSIKQAKKIMEEEKKREVDSEVGVLMKLDDIMATEQAALNEKARAATKQVGNALAARRNKEKMLAKRRSDLKKALALQEFAKQQELDRQKDDHKGYMSILEKAKLDHERKIEMERKKEELEAEGDRVQAAIDADFAWTKSPEAEIKVPELLAPLQVVDSEPAAALADAPAFDETEQTQSGQLEPLAQ